MPNAGRSVRKLIVRTVRSTPVVGESVYTAVRHSVKGEPGAAPKPLGPRAERAALHMQVCAHADDDLYFMNPELQQAIVAGTGIVTVYLTSGEADGKNVADIDPARQSTPVDFPGYTAARMNGLRAAYGFMATGDRAVPWHRQVRRAPNGAEMEIATLSTNPDIRMVFVSLSAGPRDQRARRLCHLWTGRDQDQPTLPPTGSPMTEPGLYRRQDVIDLIESLLQEFRPTVLRTLDPDPEHTSVREDGHVEYSDHADHTATAYFALAALAQYRENGGANVRVRLFRGYYNRHWPLTLGPETYERKASLLDIYGGADPHPCANPAGCGDFKISGNTRARRYGRSTQTRYPEETDWLQRMPDGRLTAFEVSHGVARQWIQRAAGAAQWDVRALDVADLAPELGVRLQPDGRIRLFGIRVRLRAKYDDQRRELVTAVQDAPGGAFGAWTGLANPNYGNGWFRTHEIGTPVCAVNADGRAQLFVRNFGMGVSSRFEGSPGSWSNWLDFGGSELQGGLSAVRLGDGRIELYGNTRTGIARFAQAEPDVDLKHDAGFTGVAAGEPAPVGKPTAALGADGRVAVFFRRHEQESVSYLHQGPDGGWDGVPIALAAGHGGLGGIAVLPLPGPANAPAEFVLAVRNRDGGVSHTRTCLDGRRTEWIGDSSLVTGAPSIALDSEDQPVIAAFGADGQLYLRRHADASQQWQQVEAYGR